jgi:hypothetical protein
VTGAPLAAGLDDIFTIKPAAYGAFDAVIPDGTLVASFVQEVLLRLPGAT